MKNVLFRKVLASVLTATTVITFIPIKASASWSKDYIGNWNWTENGQRSIGWKSINGNWYYFDYSGIMRTGWINDWGYWYYADSNGIIQTGIVEIDGKIYAFDDRGVMQSGNVSINGNTYKFNNQGYAIGDKIPSPIKTFDKGNNLLPYGSKPPYSTSDNSLNDSESEDEIFKDVETIKVRFKVTFDTDGGSSVSAITNIKSGETIDLPKEPKKDGYKFDGWYKDDDFDKEFTEDTKVRSNIKVYAKWVKENSSDDSGSGDSSSSTGDSVIVNNVQVVVGENESDIGNVKVSAKATNYSGLIDTTIDLIDKDTNEVKKTQTLNIGGSGYIKFTFTGIEKGTYYAKVTVGKVSSNSSQFTVLSKDELSNSDVIKDMNELRLQDLSLVIDDLSLPTKGSRGSNITWKSSDSNIIDNTGEVNRPDGIGIQVVKLTATLFKGSSTPVTKDFNAYVKKFDKTLGDAVKSINDAANNGANEDEKILAIKNKLTTSSMVAIGISHNQYDNYSDLNLTSKPDKEQIYQLEVAKAIYNDFKSNNYIKSNLDDEPNLYKKELENAAIGVVRAFNNAVIEQAKLKKENENQIESDKKLKEAKEKLTKVINEQYSDGASRGTLIEEQDKNTKESWTSYISALTKAIEVEFSDSNSLSSIENTISYLEYSRKSLTGAYLVTINLYKNDVNWSDFKGTISFQKGTSSSNIDAEVAGGSLYKATLTKGQYKILVDGKYTGETINIIDKTENKDLRYYTVRFEMKKPDIIDGKIIAKYGNTIDGYSEIKSSEAILNIPGNEVILMVDANSNYTNEFRYLWKKTDGSSLDGAYKADENSARIAISNIKDYGKIELVCEVNPNELIITNINGVANNDNSGSALVTSKVYEYSGQDKKVEVFKDNVLVATKDGNDVDIDASGNLKTNFTGLEKGSYKIKVTIGSLQRESSGSFYVNKIDQAVLESVNAINEAMKADATDSTYTKLRELFSPGNPKSRYLISIGLNIDGYSKLVESTNKYTIEVAKSVYRPLEYSISDVNTISKVFNDAVTKQTNIKKTDDANSEATENLKKAKEALKNALDNAMESDRTTWKKKDTDYTEESWNKYVSAVISAIKVEQNSTATLSQITSTTNTLTNAESALKEGFEGTIKINKDGNLYDGIGTITLKKFENGSFGNIVSGNNVSLGTIRTKRIESGYYNIFVNGKDTGIKIQIGKGLSNSEVLEFYTFNFSLKGTNSINVSGSTVTLTEVNNRLTEKERNKVIKNGDAVLKENNVIIAINPIMVSGIPKESEFIYQWTEVTSDINTATVYNVSKKSDVTCSVKPKNPVIISILTSSDKVGKVNIAGQIDCDNSKSVKVELLSNGNPLNPLVSNDKVGLDSDGKFSVDLNAPTSGKYTAKVTIDSVTKSSNLFDVNIEATP